MFDSLAALPFNPLSSFYSPVNYPSINYEVRPANSWQLSYSVRAPTLSRSQNGRQDGRRVWRRRKLAKRDPTMDSKLERVPFLEEQVRKIKEGGGVLSMDIERLLLSEDNRYEFVNSVAAEATEYVENNRDEYGHKKAILHVLSNRINDAGFYRPEGYLEDDPFKPGPGYLKEFYT